MLRLVSQPGRMHECGVCNEQKERLLIDEDDGLMCIECSALPTLTCAHVVTKDEVIGRECIHDSGIEWEPQYNRGYCNVLCRTRNVDQKHTYWHPAIARPLVPYRVPSGWFRLSLKVKEEDLLADRCVGSVGTAQPASD